MMPSEKLQIMRRLRTAGVTDRQIATGIGISRQSVQDQLQDIPRPDPSPPRYMPAPNHSKMSDLGIEMYNWRLRHGAMSQPKAAKILGVHPHTISRIESGAQSADRPETYRAVMHLYDTVVRLTTPEKESAETD